MVAILTTVVIITTAFQTTAVAEGTQVRNALSTEITNLTNRLLEADGHIPADFSKADMDKFLSEADPKIIAEVFEKIEKNLKAVPDEIIIPNDPVAHSVSLNSRSEAYTEYNFDTGEATTKYMKDAYFDAQKVSEKVTPQSVGTGYVSPRAWPDYWFEQNPQNYYDTRSTCLVITKLKNSDVSYGGSGFLISGDTLVTASHNIYSPDYNGWCDYIVVIPSASSSYQNGYYGRTTSTTVWIGNYYINQTYNKGDDWGVAKLEDGFNITPLPLISYGSQSHNGMWIRTQGYPLSNTVTGADGLTMYLTTGVATYAVDGSEDYCKIGNAKSYSGMSGGPVLVRNNSGQYYVAGIVAGMITETTSLVEVNDVVYVAFDTNLYNTIMSKI